MNVKRCLVTGVVVFVLAQVLDFLLHGVFLASTYEALKSVWRPDMQDKMWLMPVTGLVFAFLFAYIFAKGYEGKGVAEGLRYGLVMGAFVGVPFALGTYAMIAIPASLALIWLAGSVVQMVVLGVVASLIYKPRP